MGLGNYNKGHKSSTLDPPVFALMGTIAHWFAPFPVLTMFKYRNPQRTGITNTTPHRDDDYKARFDYVSPKYCMVEKNNYQFF